MSKSNTELGLPELPKGMFFRIYKEYNPFDSILNVQLRRKKRFGSSIRAEERHSYGFIRSSNWSLQQAAKKWQKKRGKGIKKSMLSLSQDLAN